MGVLRISGFGCLKNMEIDAERSMILVTGPQASGKSTIARLLFFCRKIRDYYVDCLCEDAPFSTVPNEGIYDCFLRYVDRYFCSCFDTAKYTHPFEISYSYPNEETLFVRSNGKNTSYRFSPVLEEKLRDSFRNKPAQKKRLRSHLSKVSNELFGFDEETVYIPAGRSILSLLPEGGDVCDFFTSDPVMGDFVELAALTMNSADCRFFITTHSPYVLTSANLLIQSAAVENRVPAKAEKTVVTESLRISPEKVSAYEIDGTLQDLIDEETGLIDSLAVDRVSEEINAVSDRLIDLEFQYDLL